MNNQQAHTTYPSEIDLDIRVIEHPQSDRPLSSDDDTDWLTCKTDSTCDGSNAC
jgi:hypothetical protein